MVKSGIASQLLKRLTDNRLPTAGLLNAFPEAFGVGKGQPHHTEINAVTLHTINSCSAIRPAAMYSPGMFFHGRCSQHCRSEWLHARHHLQHQGIHAGKAAARNAAGEDQTEAKIDMLIKSGEESRQVCDSLQLLSTSPLSITKAKIGCPGLADTSSDLFMSMGSLSRECHRKVCLPSAGLLVLPHRFFKCFMLTGETC